MQMASQSVVDQELTKFKLSTKRNNASGISGRTDPTMTSTRTGHAVSSKPAKFWPESKGFEIVPNSAYRRTVSVPSTNPGQLHMMNGLQVPMKVERSNLWPVQVENFQLKNRSSLTSQSPNSGGGPLIVPLGNGSLSNGSHDTINENAKMHSALQTNSFMKPRIASERTVSREDLSRPITHSKPLILENGVDIYVKPQIASRSTSRDVSSATVSSDDVSHVVDSVSRIQIEAHRYSDSVAETTESQTSGYIDNGDVSDDTSCVSGSYLQLQNVNEVMALQLYRNSPPTSVTSDDCHPTGSKFESVQAHDCNVFPSVLNIGLQETSAGKQSDLTSDSRQSGVFREYRTSLNKGVSAGVGLPNRQRTSTSGVRTESSISPSAAVTPLPKPFPTRFVARSMVQQKQETIQIYSLKSQNENTAVEKSHPLPRPSYPGKSSPNGVVDERLSNLLKLPARVVPQKEGASSAVLTSTEVTSAAVRKMPVTNTYTGVLLNYNKLDHDKETTADSVDKGSTLLRPADGPRQSQSLHAIRRSNSASVMMSRSRSTTEDSNSGRDENETACETEGTTTELDTGDDDVTDEDSDDYVDEDGDDDEISECSSSGDTLMSSPHHRPSDTSRPTSLVDGDVLPALNRSIFPNVPPTVNFVSEGKKVEPLPPELRKLLKWRPSTLTPNIVKSCIARSGFKMTNKSYTWIGYWGKHMKAAAFKTLRDYQKINHFPGSYQLGRKDRLWINLSRMQHRFGRQEYGFFPQTFILPADLLALKNLCEQSGTSHKWILKPPASARGIGIRVVSKYSEIPKKRALVVQQYLSSPYLINDSKFDMRIYVYVSSYDPLRIYVNENGLARFASVKYSHAMKSLSNRYMHLTNYSVNKNNSQYQSNSDDTLREGHKWSLKTLWIYLRQQGVNTTMLWEEIKDIIIKTIISCDSFINSQVKANARRRYCVHELFGFDVLLDKRLKPWVLEVNISPSLHSSSPLDVNVKGPMIQDLLNMAGYMLPDKDDVVLNPAASPDESSYKPSSSVSMDRRLWPNHKTSDERSKHAYYCQRYQDLAAQDSILDTLTADDIRMLVETIDEDHRRGSFTRVFPTPNSHKYLRYFEVPRYYNMLLDAWARRYPRSDTQNTGVTMLKAFCRKGVHLQSVNTDAKHVWSVPTRETKQTTSSNITPQIRRQ